MGDRAVGKTFLQFVRGGRDDYAVTAAAHNPDIWKFVADGQYVFRPGTAREKAYDFREFYPVDNGGTPPYFRQHVTVDRVWGYLFAKYEAQGGTGEFVPTPLPDPEDLEAQVAED